MKVDIDDVKHIIETTVSNNEELKVMLKELEILANQNKQQSQLNQNKPKKKLFAIQIEDPDQVYVVQGNEDTDSKTLVEIIKTKIIPDFNCSKKGSKHPIENFGQAFEYVANKFWSTYDLYNKTKEPLDIIRTDNKLPKVDLE
jgi:hypothetical protein